MLEKRAVAALGELASHDRSDLDRLVAFTERAAPGKAALRALTVVTAKPQQGSIDTNLLGASSDVLNPIVLAELEALAPTALTSPFGRDLFQLGALLTAAAPDSELGDTLRRRRPIEITIRPVPHQMIYDIRDITVPVGRPLVITLDNVDVMPHNVVIARPEMLETLGRMSDALAEENPEIAEASGYVPRGTEIIARASGLVLPGESTSITWIAPDDPDDYPYLCTFPGHWILMNGTIHVVPEEEYDEESEPIRITATDTGAPTREFIEDWTEEDLAPLADALDITPDSPPSAQELQVGRQLFADLGCEKCHRKAGVGGEVGPALDELQSKYTPREILRQLLDPSDTVPEEYETTMVETEDGRFFAGLVTAEDRESLQLTINPLADLPPVRIEKSEITSRDKSPLSPMPSGLLVTLERSEIRTLLRFLRWDP